MFGYFFIVFSSSAVSFSAIFLLFRYLEAKEGERERLHVCFFLFPFFPPQSLNLVSETVKA